MKKRRYKKNLTRSTGVILVCGFSLAIILLFLLFLPSEHIVIGVGMAKDISCAQETVFTNMNTIEMCGKFSLRYPRSAYPLNVSSISTSFGSLYVRTFVVGTAGALWVGEIPEELMNISDPLGAIALSALDSADNETTWHTQPDVYDDYYGNPTLFYDVERGTYREVLELKQCTDGTLFYLIYVPVDEYEPVSLDVMDSIASIKCM